MFAVSANMMRGEELSQQLLQCIKMAQTYVAENLPASLDFLVKIRTIKELSILACASLVALALLCDEAVPLPVASNLHCQCCSGHYYRVKTFFELPLDYPSYATP